MLGHPRTRFNLHRREWSFITVDVFHILYQLPHHLTSCRRCVTTIEHTSGYTDTSLVQREGNMLMIQRPGMDHDPRGR